MVVVSSRPISIRTLGRAIHSDVVGGRKEKKKQKKGKGDLGDDDEWRMDILDSLLGPDQNFN